MAHPPRIWPPCVPRREQQPPGPARASSACRRGSDRCLTAAYLVKQSLPTEGGARPVSTGAPPPDRASYEAALAERLAELLVMDFRRRHAPEEPAVKPEEGRR